MALLSDLLSLPVVVFSYVKNFLSGEIVELKRHTLCTVSKCKDESILVFLNESHLEKIGNCLTSEPD